MSKILKPYTIIPANLYVNRDADRQIENIISDMGRPGYVLVSRQMGKTNLLLNAKRKLESSNDVFVYIDLSNPFDSAKACFENIINLALEINEDAFYGAKKEIFERRKELVDTPPHKQHTNELRLLLGQISGKIVIILDEIDALTKTHYSDQVFAQIRSIYFSRVNFPVLERLTYILSGVVEPNDIIRDPKISPFNIGQKIFLNDFSKAEFIDFLSLAKISIPEEIQERIFYWANGNPRITWDLCADIESAILDGKTISVNDIDQIVKDHYLTLYDKPPIDNIRELVQQDKELRTAITEINNGNTEISDKLKNKLYLAGIINYTSNAVKIKNKVIQESLRSDWLKALEVEEKGLVNIAVENYTNEKFSNALEYFEKYLQDNEFEEVDQRTYYFMMGFSAYKLSDFDKSISYFNLTNYDLTDEPKSYYDTILLKAICYTYLEQFEEALFNYKLIIDSGRKDETYLKSLINYGSVSLKSQKDQLLDQALEIFVALGNDVDSENFKIKKSFLPEVKSIAYYNTAVIYSKKDEDDIAEKYLERAVEVASLESKPLMALALYNVVKQPERKFELLSDIANKIAAGEIKIGNFDPEFPMKFSINELNEVVIQSFIRYKDSILPMLIPVLKRIYKTDLGETIFSIGIKEITSRNWDATAAIFTALSNEIDTEGYRLSEIHQFDTLKYCCYFSGENSKVEYFISFGQMFEQLRPKGDTIDIENFAVLISQLITAKRYEDALHYISVINRERGNDGINIIDFLLIDHFELNIYTLLNDNINRIAKAREILNHASNPSLMDKKSNLINESGIDIIKRNAQDIVSSLHPKTTIVSSKKFGRNELVKVRYKDGVTIETKYKKIETDIKNGSCIILN